MLRVIKNGDCPDFNPDLRSYVRLRLSLRSPTFTSNHYSNVGFVNLSQTNGPNHLITVRHYEEIMKIDEIQKEVIKARSVFEQHHEHISKTYFGNFPSGACGSSADMLAEYLIRKGAKNIEYVFGERNSVSHGWLEIEGLIVDITGDQFNDGVEGIYISFNRDFHDKFAPLVRNKNPGINAFLREPYNKFKVLMDAHA